MKSLVSIYEDMDSAFFKQDKYGDSYGAPRLSKKYELEGLTNKDLLMMAKRIISKLKPCFKDDAMFHLFSDRCYQFSYLMNDKTGAAGHHHNFLGGLAVHTFEMLEVLYNNYVTKPENAMKFLPKSKKDNPEFRFDICALAILYHDWGKIKEYKHDEGPDANGKWQTAFPIMQKGHIFMSTEHFTQDAKAYRLKMNDIDKIQHCILAHHSYKEWGTPVEAVTAEARIVAHCDMISAENAKGQSSYFYDFVKGNLEYDKMDLEKDWKEKVAPRHKEMTDARALARKRRKQDARHGEEWEGPEF